MKTRLVVVLSLIVLTIFGMGNIACRQFEFKPVNEKGPVVIIVSGYSGPDYYLKFASRLSESGYYTIVYDVHDFVLNKTAIELKLSEVINKAQLSPNALPGKVAIIGYSMGGGLALAYAANRHDSVSNVIAYYPMTHSDDSFSFIKENEIETLPGRFKVPVFIFQGESDFYYNCCTADRIKRLSVAAKQKRADFNFVIYPGVGHGFNLGTKGSQYYNQNYDEDSWQKTMELLKKYHPLPNKRL